MKHILRTIGIQVYVIFSLDYNEHIQGKDSPRITDTI